MPPKGYRKTLVSDGWRCVICGSLGDDLFSEHGKCLRDYRKNHSKYIHSITGKRAHEIYIMEEHYEFLPDGYIEPKYD